MRTKISGIAVVAGTALLLFVGATSAAAQSREGRWEFSLGALYQLGTSLSAEGGTSVATKDDFGFVMDGGFNYSDRLAANFGFQYGSIGYDADVVLEDGGRKKISGSYDSWTMSANLILNLMEGPITPYVGAGIGWTWIDTDIPDGLPISGCWWDPWWGYICYTTYPTKHTDAFSYQGMAGLRYEFNDTTFLKLGYTSQWIDLGTASGTARFDVINAEVGWMF